jgi:phosphate transport system ATP-binding protein
MPPSASSPKQLPPVVEFRGVDFRYSTHTVLHNIHLSAERNRVTALIGPSGCGKSTLLRCVNRMNERFVGARVSQGQVFVKGKNIHDTDVDLTQLRKQVGMVFQKSNPFPKSIYDNVAYGLRIHGVTAKDILDDAVERALRSAVLWQELKDRLNQNALRLSGGEQQRLCIARAIATNPDVLLMDEPCSALDPIATLQIEELMQQLARDYTVIFVTHNMQQAVRVSDYTAFLHLGKLIEFGDTEELFSNPKQKLTESYLRGTFS